MVSVKAPQAALRRAGATLAVASASLFGGPPSAGAIAAVSSAQNGSAVPPAGTNFQPGTPFFGNSNGALPPPVFDGGLQMTAHVAVWHHHKPVPKMVTLPPFSPGHYLADSLVQVGPLPDNLVPNEDGCFCYDVADDRLAYVQTYYYAQQVLADYNALLKDLHLAQLRDVTIQMSHERDAPTSAASWHKKRPHINLRFASPAIDPFTIAREIGHLLDYRLSPRHRREHGTPAPLLNLAQEAEASGVDEGVANILAALELGTSASMPFTADTLDAMPANDVDTFVRFPDLVISRWQVRKALTTAPRFAARYATYVAGLQRDLDDPLLQEYLRQPDENASSAVINQPLWQAAVRFGFKPVKLLVLRALAEWRSPDKGYVAFGRELVETAQTLNPKVAEFLSDEYQRRGLAVPDAHLETKPN